MTASQSRLSTSPTRRGATCSRRDAEDLSPEQLRLVRGIRTIDPGDQERCAEDVPEVDLSVRGRSGASREYRATTHPCAGIWWAARGLRASRCAPQDGVMLACQGPRDRIARDRSTHRRRRWLLPRALQPGEQKGVLAARRRRRPRAAPLRGRALPHVRPRSRTVQQE